MTKSDRLVSARWRCALSRVATDGRASELLVKSQVVCFVRQLHLAAASGWNPLEPPLEAHSNTCGWSSSFETPRCGICSRQEKIRSFICQPACLPVCQSVWRRLIEWRQPTRWRKPDRGHLLASVRRPARKPQRPAGRICGSALSAAATKQSKVSSE